MDRKWWTLITVCVATFMLLLDITVVNVALPSIQKSLDASFSDLQWVVDAYALTLAAFLLTAGVLGDMFGRRGVFAAGLAIFSASSLLCGLATDPLMLNLARGAQGVGGAVMFATSLALIAQAFSGKERGTAFGIYGATIGGAVAVGPLVGGAVTSSIGWRWIFFINVPIGILAVVLTLAVIAESRDPAKRRIDYVGFVSFSAALFMLVFALVRGNEVGWGSAQIDGLFAGAAALLAIFVIAEWRGPDPMLDISLFKRPAMVGVSIATFAIAASIFAMFLYLTLFMQNDLGYSPFQAGLRFLPISVVSFFAAPLSGRLLEKIPARFLMSFGLLLVSVGCALMTQIHATSGWTVLIPGLVVAGIGIGTSNPVIASSSVAVVPQERSGMASGSSNTFRQVGIATGIAGLGAIFQHQIRGSVQAALLSTAAGREAAVAHHSTLAAAFSSGQVHQAIGHFSAAQQAAVISAYRTGFASTLDHLMWIAAAVALVGAIAALLLVRQKDFVPSWTPAAAPPAA
jgi:EmrB/QacA subfamily drug resistance transporter